MAAQPQQEGQRTYTEETPLLVDESASSILDSETQDKEAIKRPLSWYVWTVTWVLGCALILALFVKAWLDADGDVEASRHVFTPSSIQEN
jgi:hypothetical protein